ncbi:MAG: tryptophan 2,3-dioxygenase [Lysobacteraceae bacterium]|jgi:tryptophan 2,3-dioxygenase|nr:tryptophan 2,3-dioxygenase family protein [Xanthomonadaceae bacterium]MCZ8319184.1 tryptophan 2,3-dioxygenase family protein [Silanimonas sp.]
MTDSAHRPLEAGITTDLRERLTYAGYLRLDVLLAAQAPRSAPDNRDELLFIIQHQTSELWMKLALAELGAAARALAEDRLDPALKMLARVKHVQKQLVEQWSVLETLTPSEYAVIRPHLGPSSGFQSLQYRMIEFLLGNKDEAMLAVFAHAPDEHAALAAVRDAPSLYDEALRYLARRGHAVPADLLERDVRQPHARCDALVPVLARIYTAPSVHWDAYHLCESLVDLEVNFQLWRFRHLKTVQRIIGDLRGTGGSSGVAFLRQALDLTFFPELFAVRGELAASPPA